MFGYRAIERAKHELNNSGFCYGEGTTSFNPADASQKTSKPTRGRRKHLEKKNSIGSASTKMSMHVSGGWFCICLKQTFLKKILLWKKTS